MSRIVYCLVCLELLIAVRCYGSGEYKITGARSAAMSHSSVTFVDVWASFNNQAALAHLSSPVAGFYYENRFLIKELGYKAVACAIPTHSGTYALSISNFGFDLWNESKVGIAYGRSLGKYFCAGIQLNYIRIHQQEPYGNIGFVTFELSVLSQLSPSLSIGAHVYNPFGTSVSSTTNEKVPANFILGVAWDASDKFLITTEVEKSMDNDLNLRAGIEFELTSVFSLRTGISTDPATWSFGAGFNYRDFVIDISTSYHPVLGFSPQSALIYHF